MIAFEVVAHPDRRDAAGELAGPLEAWISLDEDGIGAGANHHRALTHGVSTEAEHIVVLEDDAVPIARFVLAVGAAIQQRPDQILGLYVGRQRPRAPAVETAVRKADQCNAAWLTANGLLWGVATVWPHHLAAAYLADNPVSARDTQVGRWCRRKGLEVAYAWPSLVDHRDEPSVVTGRGERPPGRVAWRTGVPDWNDVSVAI